MKISDDVLVLLNRCKFSEGGTHLELPDEVLERSLYLRVNKVLKALGGEWTKSAKAHIFEFDAEEKLNEAINNGEVFDKHKELQFFPTPDSIVNKMIELCELNKDMTVLEPSCGNGAILKGLSGITSYLNVTAVEIDEERELQLREDFNGIDLHITDFLLSRSPFNNKFDRIIMNPPFSKQQDIDHVLHAFDFLADDGVLIAIMSESTFFRHNKKSIEFRNFLDLHNTSIEELEHGDFKESGTMVKTRIVMIKRWSDNATKERKEV